MKSSPRDSLPLPDALRELAAVWLDRVRVPRRRALWFVAFVVFLVAMWGARYGTWRARALAGASLAAFAVAVFVWSRRERALWQDPARVVDRVASGFEPEGAARAKRAIFLAASPKAIEGASSELVSLHVARTLAALPQASVAAGAARWALGYGVVTVLALAGAVGSCAANPWAAVEGIDVLLAKDGVAPMDMSWLAQVDARGRPPEYLHQDERRIVATQGAALPRGTLITLRGRPVHVGRLLVLTDGKSEVPFVDDGTGAMVARWPLVDTAELRVAARFGDVLIREGDALMIESIPDALPVVRLDEAPRQIMLATEDVREIPIRYEATDDHGLREVHLVLRTASREERRVLAKLDGETKHERGGHVLRTTDPFLKRAHTPVEIRVEAKDNDAVTGPKWGASESITVVPPNVGESEAKRLAVLMELRGAFVDTLAHRMMHPPPSDPKQRRDYTDDEKGRARRGDDDIERALGSTFAGLRVPARLQAIIRGQSRKLKEAHAALVRNPSATSHAGVVRATERFVLVVDAVVQGLGMRDTKDVAKRLVEPAEDLALACVEADRNTERAKANLRADGEEMVLRGGRGSLAQLGTLGRDIGEIVEAYLQRVDRARGKADFLHAELAARDLAARLQTPDPSFGARGQSGHAGGESGGQPGLDEGSEGGDVEQAFNEAAHELEQLAMDHAANMGSVEQALSTPPTAEDVQALADELRKRAQKIRDTVRPLPSVGAGSDSWTSKGATAKEHAEQMAHAMEQTDPAEAVAAGRNALGALDEASRTARSESAFGFGRDETRDGLRRLDDVRRKLEPEVRWMEERLDALKKRAARRAGDKLGDPTSKEQAMAERTRQLADRGKDQQALPGPALDALQDAERAARQAARALGDGDAEAGLTHQREAQRKLELARQSLDDDGSDQDRTQGEGENGDPGGNRESAHAEIPKADAHKGPEDFRRRVLRGLSQGSGRHKSAVERYAEGLLR